MLKIQVIVSSALELIFFRDYFLIYVAVEYTVI